MIGEFRGETRWLSNFAKVLIYYNGVAYESTEGAYQAQKTMDEEVRRQMSIMSPAGCKSLGMALKLRPDWDDVKLKIMEDVNRIKFSQEPFKSKLLATGNEHLVEGNDWGDKYWGVVNGQGENRLGSIIMKIREELRNEKGTVQISDT